MTVDVGCTMRSCVFHGYHDATMALLPASSPPWGGRERSVRVLLSAFACDPAHGGEPAFGWHWATSLAECGCEVEVLVPAFRRAAIEAELEGYPRDRLRFEYVPVPRVPIPGFALREKARYVLWQVAVARVARARVAETDFDVLHHVTYGSLQGGSLLGRLGLPFVFGPVGGGQTAERELSSWFGRAWWGERLRTIVTRWAALLPLARSAVRRAEVVLAVNEETAALARRLGARSVVTVLDTALPSDYVPAERQPPDVGAAEGDRPKDDLDRPFRVLWLGRALPRKGLNLAVRAFHAASLPRAELVVAGGGPCEADVARLVETLGCADRVTMLGQVPYARVPSLFQDADVFLFTSLRDSFGSQLLEAAAFGLPLVVLDHHGAADHLPDAAVRKVSIAPPDELVAALAGELRALAGDSARPRGRLCAPPRDERGSEDLRVHAHMARGGSGDAADIRVGDRGEPVGKALVARFSEVSQPRVRKR